MTPSLEAIRSELNAAITGAESAAADELCAAVVRMVGVDGAALSMIFDGESQGTFGSSSESSRLLDEYQFTFGEGPCLDTVATREPVLVPDLDAPHERRWPAFAGAVLSDGVRGVFAVPIMLTSIGVGALDLFREGPGPMSDDQLAGALLAAELASLPLLELLTHHTLGADNLETNLMAVGEDAWGHLADMDRIEVYQATGMLISQLEVTAPEALVRLRAHAIATSQTASEVARAIVERRLVLDRDPRHGTGRTPQ